MIKIEFQEPNSQAWNTWLNACAVAQDSLNQSVASGSRKKVNGKLYKAENYHLREEFYFDLDGPFHGKCAYCEENIFRNQHGDIEHFRPHGRVTDENGLPIEVNLGTTTVTHPGYYWLAYDWHNLLPSCVLCNQSSTIHSGGRRIGKVDRFPVAAFRATHPGEETREKPLLIHPIFEDPELHLQLDDDCIYVALDDRGQTCIELFGLNARDLPNARMEMYRHVRQLFGVLLQTINEPTLKVNSQQFIEKLKRLKSGWGPHTAAARKAIIDGFVDNQSLEDALLYG